MNLFPPRTAEQRALRLLRHLVLCCIPIVSLAISGCGDDAGTTPPTTEGGNLTGTLYFEKAASGVHKYSFATQVQTSLFKGRCPAVFPSGEMVVLDEYAQLLEVVNATGTSRTEIYKAPDTYMVFEPKVSPDGNRIAFSYLEDFRKKIKTIVITRAGAPVAEFNNLGSPSWMSDGRLVMSGSWRFPFELSATTITPGGNSSIFISDAALTTAIPIGTPIDKPLTPVPSPDGSRIAFELSGHIWTMNIDGSGIKQITTGTKADKHPAWSPDGKYIACICYGIYEVHSYNAIGIVPSNPAAPTDMLNTNDALWPRDKNALGDVWTGRLTGTDHITWK